MCGQSTSVGVAWFEAGIEAIAFTHVTGLAQGLKVTQIVGATACEGDDVVNLQVGRLAATLALMAIAVQNVLAYVRTETGSGCRFGGHRECG